jgi:glutamate racemase
MAAQGAAAGGGTGPGPIGVFDSGMGGLTVLRALRQVLPDESFLYLGDTARLPYGTKSAATVQRYALQAAEILVRRGVKALVIACNTASAVALHALQARYASIPVFGVVAPGARAAAAVAARHVVVLGTESTIRGGAYQRALLACGPRLAVHGRACPLLVALAEEGRHQGPLAELAVREYLRGLVGAGGAGERPEVTLLLGCTHFPVFRPTIIRVLGAAARSVQIVDSAATTAAAVLEQLRHGRFAAARPGTGGQLDMFATDGVERFRRVGSYFLGEPVTAVQLVDL